MHGRRSLKLALAAFPLAALVALLALALSSPIRPAPEKAPRARVLRPPAPRAVPRRASAPRPPEVPPFAAAAPEVEAPADPVRPAAMVCRLLDAESRKPVTPAEVRLLGEGVRQLGRADPQGVARFYGIEPGRYVLAAESPAHLPAKLEVSLASPPLEVELLLHRGHTLCGMATVAGGRPLAGVEVSGEVAGAGPGRRAVTGEDGRYRLEGLPAGTVEVEARSQTMSPSVLAAAVEFPDGPPVEMTVDFMFAEPARLKGRVIDFAGRPVPGASVSIAIQGSFAPFETSCAEDGSFEFAALPEGAAELSARAAGGVLENPVRVDLRSGIAAEVVIRLAGGGVLAGRVLDPNGRGFAGVRVQAETGAADEQPACATTDEEGRFAFEALRPGTYRCRAVCPGYPDALSEPIVLQAGVELRLPDLRIYEGLEVCGEVVGEDGRPIGGARVEAQRDGASKAAARAVSDADGTFVLRGLEPGDYAVRARAAGYARGAPIRLEVRSGAAATIRLVLGRRAVVAGLVQDNLGRPLAGALVLSLGGPGRIVRTGADGSFRLEVDSSASQPVLVHAAGYAPARLTATPGEAVVVVLEPARAGASHGLAIRGMIRVGGEPAEGLLLLAVDARKEKPAPASGVLAATSGPGGVFAIPVPAPGTYEVAVFRRHGHEEHAETRLVEVGPDGASLTWELQAARH